MKIIDGNKIAENIANELKGEISNLILGEILPKLVILGSNPDSRSLVYIKAKMKRAESIGINTDFLDISSLNKDKQIELIHSLNNDPKVSGIILQLPFQTTGKVQELIDQISPSKDVDGLTSFNQEKIASDESKFIPATPLAVLKIIERYKIDVHNKTICIIGRSNLVGGPLKILLKKMHAHVLVAHSKTTDVKKLTINSDIIISAAGKPNIINSEMVKEGVILIDVGITAVDGKIVGDINPNGMSKKANLISPVPGGVGPITVVMLLSNVLNAYKKQVAQNLE